MSKFKNFKSSGLICMMALVTILTNLAYDFLVRGHELKADTASKITAKYKKAFVVNTGPRTAGRGGIEDVLKENTKQP